MRSKFGNYRIVVFFVAALMLFSVMTQGIYAAGKVRAEEDLSINNIEGLQFQLDAQALDMESGSVSSVKNGAANADLEGVGDAKQNDPAKQPAFVKESAINGKPALRFEKGDYMQIGKDMGFYLEDMTIFVVGNFKEVPSNGTAQIVSRLAAGDPWNHNWYFNLENGMFNYGWYTGTGHSKYTTAVSANQTYVLAGRKSETKGEVFVNGLSKGTFVGEGPDAKELKTPVNISSSGTESLVGDIGEILIFDRGLTTSEVIRVERYLEEKWGIKGIHDGQLADIRVNGEIISGFRSDKLNYSVLLSKDDAEKEIKVTATAWNSNEKVTVEKVSESNYEITVGRSVYTLEIETMKYAYNEIKQLNANEVKLNDGFWDERYRQYSIHTVNYMFDMFDLSKSFDNFDRVAAGEKKVLGNTSAHAGQILKPLNDRDIYNTDWEWIYEPWREGLIYEGIRAASEFIMVNHADGEYADDVAELTTRLDGYISRIYAASLQTTGKDGNGKPIDGYFSTYNILDRTGVIDETDVAARYHHDVYNYGCLTEAAVYWYNATGDTRLLFAATRFTEFLVDYINGADGYQGYDVVPAHELPEEALQNLYDLYNNNPDLVKLMEEKYSRVEGLSSKDRYYDLDIRLAEYKEIAASWITGRGDSSGRYNNTNYGSYAQDNVTFDEMTEAIGHAVRANLWYNGIALIGNRQENFEFVSAAKTIWDNIVDTQMYVTGGTGSTNDGEEAYGGSNQLPHNGYCETCASVGMAFFSQNMFNIFGDAKYADIVELEMYNGILGCLGLDGNTFYYTNPMVSDDYTRPMFSNVTPCCVPMFLKYFSELPEIIYAKTDSLLFVNQYISSSAQTAVGDKSVTVVQDTDMPNGDSALFSVSSEGAFTLKLRMPSWANGAAVKVNGKTVSAEAGADGYIDISLTAGRTTVEVVFGKEVIRLYQDYAEDNVGMVSFKYGPFVYCAEEIDNTVSGLGNILANNKVSVAKDAAIAVSVDESTFEIKLDGKNGTPVAYNVLKAEAEVNGQKVTLTLIPFYLRGNRLLNDKSMGEMDVWFKEG